MYLLVCCSLSLTLWGQTKVKLHVGVPINGIKQWIGATGADDSKPLLLFIHGGPGFSSRSYAKYFSKYLKQDFIVAQWDQRETGITAHWSPYTDTLTLELFHHDTRAVVEYLLQHFDRKKLYLVGFSWGNFLGMHFAQEHPEMLHAYVSVSGMLHNARSEVLTLQATRAKARGLQHQEALDDLAEVSFPYQDWQALYRQRKWSAVLLGNGKLRNYPPALFEDWSAKWFNLFLAASRVDYVATIPELACPVYLLASAGDFVAHHQLTQEFYDQVEAPQKQLVWFPGQEHELPGRLGKAFGKTLLQLLTDHDGEVE